MPEIIDRIACVNCDQMKKGKFLLSLSTMKEENAPVSYCGGPNNIFFFGLKGDPTLRRSLRES